MCAPDIWVVQVIQNTSSANELNGIEPWIGAPKPEIGNRDNRHRPNYSKLPIRGAKGPIRLIQLCDRRIFSRGIVNSIVCPSPILAKCEAESGWQMGCSGASQIGQILHLEIGPLEL